MKTKCSCATPNALKEVVTISEKSFATTQLTPCSRLNLTQSAKAIFKLSAAINRFNTKVQTFSAMYAQTDKSSAVNFLVTYSYPYNILLFEFISLFKII